MSDSQDSSSIASGFMESGFVVPGTLLLSAPNLHDPNFMHSVVLMLAHDDDGAVGLVVNRKLGATVGELLDRAQGIDSLGPPMGGSTLDHVTVNWGGPVGADNLQILRRASGPSDGECVLLTDEILIGGDLEDAVQLALAADVPDQLVRFVLGYSGWGGGQLESELELRSWLPLPSSADLVFSEQDDDAVWRAAVSRLEGGGPALAHLPPDPSWN